MQQLDAQLSSLDVGLALRALGAVARRFGDLPVAQLVVDAWIAAVPCAPSALGSSLDFCVPCGARVSWVSRVSRCKTALACSAVGWPCVILRLWRSQKRIAKNTTKRTTKTKDAHCSRCHHSIEGRATCPWARRPRGRAPRCLDCFVATEILMLFGVALMMPHQNPGKSNHPALEEEKATDLRTTEHELRNKNFGARNTNYGARTTVHGARGAQCISISVSVSVIPE